MKLSIKLAPGAVRRYQAKGSTGVDLKTSVDPATADMINRLAISNQRSVSSVIAELLEIALAENVVVESDDPTGDEIIQRGQNPRNMADSANATLERIRRQRKAAGVPDIYEVIIPKPTREDFEFGMADPKTGEWKPDYDPVKRVWKR